MTPEQPEESRAIEGVYLSLLIGTEAKKTTTHSMQTGTAARSEGKRGVERTRNKAVPTNF